MDIVKAELETFHARFEQRLRRQRKGAKFLAHAKKTAHRTTEPPRARDDGHRLPPRQSERERSDGSDDRSAGLFGGSRHAAHPRTEGPAAARKRRAAVRLRPDRQPRSCTAKRARSPHHDILRWLGGRRRRDAARPLEQEPYR